METMTPAVFRKNFNEALEAYSNDPVSSPYSDTWKRAIEMKIFDGSKPHGFFTREQAAGLLNKLKLFS